MCESVCVNLMHNPAGRTVAGLLALQPGGYRCIRGAEAGASRRRPDVARRFAMHARIWNREPHGRGPQLRRRLLLRPPLVLTPSAIQRWDASSPGRACLCNSNGTGGGAKGTMPGDGCAVALLVAPGFMLSVVWKSATQCVVCTMTHARAHPRGTPAPQPPQRAAAGALTHEHTAGSMRLLAKTAVMSSCTHPHIT